MRWCIRGTLWILRARYSLKSVAVCTTVSLNTIYTIIIYIAALSLAQQCILRWLVSSWHNSSHRSAICSWRLTVLISLTDKNCRTKYIARRVCCWYAADFSSHRTTILDRNCQWHIDHTFARYLWESCIRL